jgi:hypothetical protein
MSEAEIEFVQADGSGADPQGPTVDIDRFFTAHAQQLEAHDWGLSEPAPALAKLAQMAGIPVEDTRQRVPLPWTERRRNEHTQHGQAVRDYVAAMGYAAFADDAAHLTALADELAAQQQRLRERYQALPAMDGDDLGDAGDYDFADYAQELDDIIAEHKAWRQRVRATIADVATVAEWLEDEHAGYNRARAILGPQPAAARRIGDMLANPQPIPEHDKVTRADVKLPDVDGLSSGLERLLRLRNKRNTTRLALKAIHDATTGGRPLPKEFRDTFRRAGKVAR